MLTKFFFLIKLIHLYEVDEVKTKQQQQQNKRTPLITLDF